MIEKVLPEPVIGAELFGDTAVGYLFPEEYAQVRDAVTKRYREYATVRFCARSILPLIGAPPAPLPTGPGGAPKWPSGVVGSMTHCAGYRAAAVARSSELRSLGIDAEPHAPLPEDVLTFITRREERAHIRRLTVSHPDVHWDTIWFSAKEAVYKTWYPVMNTWLNFSAVSIVVTADTVSPGLSMGFFRAHLTGSTPNVPGDQRPMAAAVIKDIAGRWRCESGFILTSASNIHPPTGPPRSRASERFDQQRSDTAARP